MKLLLQVQDGATALTVREGWNRMAAEGAPSLPPVSCMGQFFLLSPEQDPLLSWVVGPLNLPVSGGLMDTSHQAGGNFPMNSGGGRGHELETSACWPVRDTVTLHVR